MELRQIRYFIAVAEELHFARAAARAGIQQSPLSKAITEMEQHLGVRLFTRTRRSTQLTYVGEMFLNDARRIMTEVELAHRNIKAAAAGRSGRLRIAICDGVAHPKIARLLAEMREHDPTIDTQVVHGPLPVQCSQICSGVLDVSFSLSPRNDLHLRSFPLWKDGAVLLMRSDHPLSVQPIIRQIDDRVGQLLLLGDRLPDGGQPLGAWLLSCKHKFESIECIRNIELLLTLVSAGYGVGLIGTAQAEMINRLGLEIRPLSISGATITTFLIARREDPSSVVSRFAERAQKMV